MKKTNIVVIGAGNMGRSLIGGLVRTGYDPKTIWAIDPNPEKLAALQLAYQVQTTSDLAAAVKQAAVILLAVKPQAMATVVHSLVEQLPESALLLSVAAGITTTQLQAWLSRPYAIVRCMPNTPALLGYGATGLYANPHTSLQQQQLAEAILAAVGIVEWFTDEADLDTVTALSGSGPAYFFLMLEALVNAAVAAGLPPQTARRLAAQTALGAAQMVLQSTTDLAELRRQVTSPGGTTEQGIKVLEAQQVPQAVQAAVQAAKRRAEVLGGQLSED